MELEKEMWIIDTDPGTDDMMCLIYLLHRKDIDIKMISLVEGNTSLKNVQANIRKILQITNRLDIPVYNASQTILFNDHNCSTDIVHGNDGLGSVPELINMKYDHIPLAPGNASLKMIELINKYPNKINLLMIGPLTNLAVAYMLCPEILNLLKSFYSMGGAINFNGNINPGAEFNFAYDYIATKVIIPRANKLTIVPWEPIEEHIFKLDDFISVKEVVTKSEKQFCTQKTFFVEKLFEKRMLSIDEGFMMCDLYAAMCIFHPKLVESCFLAEVDIIVDSDSIRGAIITKNKIKLENFIQGRDLLNSGKYPGMKLIVERMKKEDIVDQLPYLLYI